MKSVCGETRNGKFYFLIINIINNSTLMTDIPHEDAFLLLPVFRVLEVLFHFFSGRYMKGEPYCLLNK